MTTLKHFINGEKNFSLKCGCRTHTSATFPCWGCASETKVWETNKKQTDKQKEAGMDWSILIIVLQ